MGQGLELKHLFCRNAAGEKIKLLEPRHPRDQLVNVRRAQVALEMAKVVIVFVTGPAELEDSKGLKVWPARKDVPAGFIAVVGDRSADGIVRTGLFVSPAAN